MNHEEDKIVAALTELCKQHNIQTLIQIGAEDGYEAVRVKERTDCRAIAIEGNRNVASCDSNLEFHHDVIGWSDTGQTLFYVHQDTGLSGLIPRNDGRESAIAVYQYRLDTWCKLHGGIKPDALIIDTEGTTLDVLEGCGTLLDNMKLIYAECQTKIMRPGMRLLSEVDDFLVEKGMTQHHGLPAYNCEDGEYPIPQGNYTWVRE